MVIMSHGFRGSSIGPARTFVDFEQILLKEGFSVLRYDQIGCGNSDEDFLSASYNQWIDNLVFLTQKYLDQGYKIALLGQSMGGSTTVVATSRKELKDKIPCILLWVPGVNDLEFEVDPNKIYEEAGQKYYGRFWTESKNSNFFKCLDEFKGGVHLVYGEKDKFISQNLRNKVIDLVKSKGEEYMVLKGQDHSPWEHDIAQEVYRQEFD